MSGFVSIIDHKVERCFVCNSYNLREFAQLNTPYLDKSEHYLIRDCLDCGHGEAEGRRDKDYLASIYSGQFFATGQQAIANASAPVHINAKARAEWVSTLARGRLLDIGCGQGAFLSAASVHFDAEGIEFSEAAVQVAKSRGLNVKQGDFQTIELERESYDIITLWDVLASLSDPATVFSQARNALKRDGQLVLTIPMIDSRIARIAGRYWPMLIPPVNLHYFSRNSISRLAMDHGFKVGELRYETKLVSLSFIVLKACRSLRLPNFVEKLAKRLPQWPVRVNTGDIATVTFTREKNDEQ